jgi:hypothetical protein
MTAGGTIAFLAALCLTSPCVAGAAPDSAVELDPHIAEVGPCVWRTLGEKNQQVLLGAQVVGGFVALNDAFRAIGGAKAFTAPCDPNYAKHVIYSDTSVYGRILHETALLYFAAYRVDPKGLDDLLAKAPAQRAGIDYIAWSVVNGHPDSDPSIAQGITTLAKSIPSPSTLAPGAEERDRFEFFIFTYWYGHAEENVSVRRLTDPRFVAPVKPTQH